MEHLIDSTTDRIRTRSTNPAVTVSLQRSSTHPVDRIVIEVAANQGGKLPDFTKVEALRAATVEKAYRGYVDDHKLYVGDDRGHKFRFVKPENQPRVLEALGLPSQMKLEGYQGIRFEHDEKSGFTKIIINAEHGSTIPSARLESVFKSLADLKVSGQPFLPEDVRGAITRFNASAPIGAVTEVASRAGKTALRAIGPVAAVSDVLSYAANQKEAEAKLLSVLGKGGAAGLSKEAVSEYGEIVAKLRIEQGVTFGLSEAMGFSNFVDWGKKHNLPVEALEKLNPTSKTKAQLEEALNARGGLMSQAEPEVRVAQAPDVRLPNDRGIA